MADGYPRCVPVSDCGLLVEFGDAVGGPAHDAVLALDRALAARPVPGQREVVPAYVNLMLVFDPAATDHAAVRAAVEDRLTHPPEDRATGRQHEVPVCYDGDFGRDLAAVAEAAGLTPEAVIAAQEEEIAWMKAWLAARGM